MSEFNPLNDPDLEHLEESLTAITLAPRREQRERLLYACGHAAGRAEMKRLVRSVSAVAAMLGCISVGLSFFAFKPSPLQMAEVEPATTTPDESKPRDTNLNASLHKQQSNDHTRDSQLRAGTSFEQLLIVDRLRRTEPLMSVPASPSSKHVLSAITRSWPDELWE